MYRHTETRTEENAWSRVKTLENALVPEFFLDDARTLEFIITFGRCITSVIMIKYILLYTSRKGVLSMPTLPYYTLQKLAKALR